MLVMAWWENTVVYKMLVQILKIAWIYWVLTVCQVVIWALDIYLIQSLQWPYEGRDCYFHLIDEKMEAQ